MNRGQRAALITSVANEMFRHGSWCGETHLQKALFILEEVLGVDAGFEFILYKHGPFSFDLRDDLTAMSADGLVDVVIRQPGYGPSYVPTEFSKKFLGRFPKTFNRYRDRISFVARELGDSGVSELERLATALYIVRRNPERCGECAQELTNLKPHITLDQATAACEQAKQLISRARSLKQVR